MRIKQRRELDESELCVMRKGNKRWVVTASSVDGDVELKEFTSSAQAKGFMDALAQFIENYGDDCEND